MPRVYAVSPIVQIPIEKPVTVKIQPINPIYTKADIQELVDQTPYPQIFDKLIGCESQWTNIARIDSNGKMSYGILQFQQSTWDGFAPRAGVTSTPMNPVSALKVATYMIKNGYLARWTCAKLTHLI